MRVICRHARTPAQQKFAQANPGVEEQLITHIPLGRMGEAEQDIGGAVVMLSSSDARYVTVQTIMVNGAPNIGCP